MPQPFTLILPNARAGASTLSFFSRLADPPHARQNVLQCCRPAGECRLRQLGQQTLGKAVSIDFLICGSCDICLPDHDGRSGREMTDRNGIDSFIRNGPRSL